MLKVNSGGKYGGVVREFKPKKYTGDNIIKRAPEKDKEAKLKKYTFNTKDGTVTFSANSLEEARRIAKSMKASVRTGRKK